jgi:hypothetical protein
MTAVDDLAAWLTEILKEDEARVRAAIDDDCGQDGGFEDSFDRLTGGPERGGPTAVLPRFGEAAAALIVWNTPRRALARIAADRQILALHAVVVSDANHAPLGPTCSTCGAWEEYPEDWPCQTVKLLALPHADRPGYQEAWRPA